MESKNQEKNITRRSFLRSTAFGTLAMAVAPGKITEAFGNNSPNALFTFGAPSVSLDEVKGSKPNIIFIMADDLGYNDLSIMGQKRFRTPGLDRMAEEGMIFTDHYSGSTVCAPSRAAFLTGQHTGHLWQRGNGQIEFRPDPDDITIATQLKEAGYHTAMIGKSGLACNSNNATLPNEKGFDHFFGFLAHGAAHRFYPTTLYRNGNAVDYPENSGRYGETYTGDEFLADTLEYLEQRGNESQPFFLHLAIQQPHADLAVPEKFRQPYMGQFEENPWTQPNAGYTCQSHPAATYAGMISYADHTVEKVLQKLRELGIDEDTLVIFSSDNGSYSEGGYHYSVHESNSPFRGGKRDFYDGGIRVPTIAWWPGKIRAGRRTNHISAFWDFPPTALELAGKSIPEYMDGISYLPTLLSRPEQQEQHKYLYWEFYEQNGKQAVRYGKWKGVRLNVKDNRYGPIELYDTQNDISESSNLADEYPDVVAQIAGFMEEAHEEPESDLFSFD